MNYYVVLRKEFNKKGELQFNRFLESVALYTSKRDAFKQIKDLCTIYEVYDNAKIDFIENEQGIVKKETFTIVFFIQELYKQ